MSKVLTRTAIAGLAVTLWSALVALPASGASADSEPQENALQACVRTNHKLNVLFLVDTSQSLAKSDPDSARVVGLISAVSALQAIGGGKTKVRVELVEFGTSPTRTLAPAPLWETPPSDVTDVLLKEFRTKSDQQDTDYVSALKPWPSALVTPWGERKNEAGAIDLLAESDPGVCRLLVWFTDGKFDIDDKSGKLELPWHPETTNESIFRVKSAAGATDAERKGRELLCDGKEPLTNQLRQGSIDDDGAGSFVTAIALGSTKSDFDLIEDIAGGECGSEPPRGQFLPADDVGQLVLQLRNSVLPDQGDPELSTGIKSGEDPACSGADSTTEQDFDYPFTLTEATTSVNLFTLAADPKRVSTSLLLPPEVSPPIRLTGSQTVTLKAEQGKLIVKEIDEGVFQVTAELKGADGWWATQPWKVRFCSSDGASDELLNLASVHVVTDLDARLIRPNLRQTLSSTVQGEVIGRTTGLRVSDAGLLAGSAIDISVGGQVVATPEIKDDGTFEFPYTPREQDTEATFTGTLRPQVRLGAEFDPVPLDPISLDLGEYEVAPKPTAPVVGTPKFDRALDQEHDSIEAVVPVDASKENMRGCLRFSKFEFDLPELNNSFEVVADAEKQCFNDGSDEIVLTLRSTDPGALLQRQPITGTMEFTAEDAKGGQEEPQVVAFSAEVVPLLKTVTDAQTAWLLVLLAVVIPFALLYIGNLLQARLVVGSVLVAEIPVLFANNSLKRLLANGDRVPLTLAEDDVDTSNLLRAGRHRSLPITGGVTLHARAPWFPLNDVYGEARAAGAALVVGDLGTAHGVGRVDTALKRTWVFRTDTAPVRSETDGPPEPQAGYLTLLVPPGPARAREHVQNLLTDIERVLGNAVEHVAKVPVASPPESIPATVGTSDQGVPWGSDEHAKSARSEFTPDWMNPWQSAESTSTSSMDSSSTKSRKRDRNDRSPSKSEGDEPPQLDVPF
jgi:hypothetical protein